MSHVVDVSQPEFEAEVLERSFTVPVLVDFWAPWCGPCRTLGPILERMAEAAGGSFVLAKVNSDLAPEVASRFGVRGIPNVQLFIDGKVAGQFVGALPESRVQSFLDQHLPNDADRALAEAKIALAQPDLATARAALARIPERAAQREAADQLAALVSLIEDAGAAGPATALDTRIAADPKDLEARLARAGHHLGAGELRPALDQLLAIATADRRWRDEAARKLVLAVFELCGPRSELASEYRRRLMVVS